MSYNKQTWQTGDIITADKLNHMEDGIASGGVFLVTATDSGEQNIFTIDKSYSEIIAALNNGQIPMLLSRNDIYPLITASYSDEYVIFGRINISAADITQISYGVLNGENTAQRTMKRVTLGSQS